MAERDLSVDHVTIWRWAQRYAPVLNQRIRTEMRRPNRSWRVDETCVKVAGSWAYLYRAVDSAGETIEFMLSPKRDLIAAKLFQRLALSGGGPSPRVINVDGHPAYASAVADLQQTGELGRRCRSRTRLIGTTSSSRPSLHQEADYGEPRLPIGRQCVPKDRGQRGDACHPQRAGPLGSQRRCRRAALVHPRDLRHRRVAPTHAPSSPSTPPICNRFVLCIHEVRVPPRLTSSPVPSGVLQRSQGRHRVDSQCATPHQSPRQHSRVLPECHNSWFVPRP